MALSFDILTIFPGMFPSVLGESIVARALAAGIVRVALTDIRDFAHDRHRSVDDRPYGGGPGMVFKPEPVFAAVESVLARARASEEATRKVILTPQGRRLEQRDLRQLSGASWVVLLCGHYEGFDERILEGLKGGHGFEEVSIGDYVLSGGEIPAMVILDGVARLLPGALGHPESAALESFESGRLDYPQYTRPPEFRGMRVPEVLLSGNHQEIERWRRDRAVERTRERRGDLVGPQAQAARGRA
ncbi:MAG: tRNA (guanosine(37)-N1)-methyltransferase TrmD [Planctomycetes bacterium]|nr:tRNA (guanosine(37)-N1)-methyltransferase TrmD [Planctomycetota bacterium]